MFHSYRYVMYVKLPKGTLDGVFDWYPNDIICI